MRRVYGACGSFHRGNNCYTVTIRLEGMNMRTSKSNIYLFVVLISTTLSSINVWAAQTVHINLEIDGNYIEGESTIASLGREGTIEAFSAGFNVSTPFDSTGSRTGAHLYRPFTILKRIDKSSPLLFRALTMNEPVTLLEAMYFRPDVSGSGSEEKFMTIKLENAYIVGIVQTSESTVTGGENAPPVLELISFVFQNITMTYEIGGVTHTDTIAPRY